MLRLLCHSISQGLTKIYIVIQNITVGLLCELHVCLS